jgi:hypothetical protein
MKPARTQARAAQKQALTTVSLQRILGPLALGCAVLSLAGCETGRTNKVHAEWQKISDVSTTGKPKPSPAIEIKAEKGELKAEARRGQPPVPGSPTAAGEDGNQPFDDMDARPSPATERGEAAPPRVE